MAQGQFAVRPIGFNGDGDRRSIWSNVSQSPGRELEDDAGWRDEFEKSPDMVRIKLRPPLREAKSAADARIDLGAQQLSAWRGEHEFARSGWIQKRVIDPLGRNEVGVVHHDGSEGLSHKPPGFMGSMALEVYQIQAINRELF